MKRILWGLLNVAQWSFIAAWSVLWITVALVARLVTGSAHSGLTLARRVWAPGVLRAGFIRLEVQGADQLVPGRPWFLACNHQAFADIPALFTALPVDLRFVAKQELRRVPFLGWYMEAMGMVFVDRRRRTSGAAGVDAAAELLRRGASVLSFPAGTRRRVDEPPAFRPAAFAPALVAGVPVVPVAIHGTGRVNRLDGRLRPGVVRVMVGAPLPTVGLALGDREEVARSAEAALTTMLERLTAEAAAAGTLTPAYAGERV